MYDYAKILMQNQEMDSWERYIRIWQPAAPGDLPSPPPLSDGWALWWQRVGL